MRFIDKHENLISRTIILTIEDIISMLRKNNMIPQGLYEDKTRRIIDDNDTIELTFSKRCDPTVTEEGTI